MHLEDKSGHRKRVKQKVMKIGFSSLSDYEVLEILLYFTQARKDTRQIAKNILTAMGSLTETFCSDKQKLMSVKQIGPTTCVAIKTIHEIMCRILREKLLRKSLLDNVERVMEYCNLRMSGSDVEQVRVLFLNKKNFMISDELQQTGTIDHSVIYPREIMKRALNIGAAAIILVHNHPSGDATPSSADVEITKKIAHSLASVDIKVHDHIIVGKYGCISMRSEGII